jgi:5'-methylthioadenosine phosphorylase
MVTDYDCWHPDHDSVTVEQIVGVLTRNAENAAEVVRQAVAALPAERSCKCGQALAMAIMTAPDAIPLATRAKLDLLVGKYLSAKAGA